MNLEEEFIYTDDQENDSSECLDDADDERDVDDYAENDDDSDYDIDVSEIQSPQKRCRTAINNGGPMSIRCMLDYEEEDEEEEDDDDHVCVDLEPITQVKIPNTVKDIPELCNVAYDAETDRNVLMSIIKRRDARLKKRAAMSPLGVRKRLRLEFDTLPIRLEHVNDPATTPHLSRYGQYDDDVGIESSVEETITTTSFEANVRSKITDVELEDEDDFPTFPSLSSPPPPPLSPPTPQPRSKSCKESKRKTRKRTRSKSTLNDP